VLQSPIGPPLTIGKKRDRSATRSFWSRCTIGDGSLIGIQSGGAEQFVIVKDCRGGAGAVINR